ncbi:translocation/assembly module TamB domain-containing protein [Sporomusa sp. GT1]|uniref:translocation/assembly module TamB domain-containing protein n=1 Tax=Sporomusa sp. GT1 TaxID=1534747 RepID=UPI001667D7F7|nr:translocation/assembly module TamB domain-containing protein [Sporomusa sp. GT1]
MRTKAIAVILILFVLVMAAFAWWSAHSPAVFSRIETTLATELTAALGTQVEVGQLHIAGLSSAAVDGVTVFDKQGRKLAVIEQVTVDYNILRLARGQTAIDAIRQITLTRPEVLLVEEPDSVWNIACLAQESKPDDSAFNGKIVVKEAAVRIQALQGTWDLTGADGQLIIKNGQSIDIKLSASLGGSPVTARGFVNTARKSLSVTVAADKLHPAAYQPLVPAKAGLVFTDGALAELEVTVVSNSAGLSYAGEFLLEDLSVQVQGVPVAETRGRVSFTNNAVYLLGTSALINNQPVAARGKIAIAGDQPVFDLSVESANFDVATISYNLPVAGIIAFSAKLTGTLAMPVATAELSAKEAVIADYQLQAASAKVNFADNQLQLEQFAAQMLGGQVQGQGTLDLTSRQYQVQLAASNLDAAAAQDLPVALSGRGDISLSVTGQGTDWQTINGLVAVTLADGQLAGVPYTKMTALVERTGSLTEIKHYDLILPSGLITAAGVMEDEQLKLAIEGQGIELAQLPFAIKDIHFAGTAGFQGQLTGTLTQPQLALKFDADGLSLNQEPWGQARGFITASPDRVAFEKVILTNGAALHDFSGTITFAGIQPECNLTLTTHAARAETFVRPIIPKLALTGNIEHELIIRGPLVNPAVSGRVKLSEGSLAGYLIGKAEGTYQWQNGLITVNQLDIDSITAKIKLSGTVTADESLDFAVAAENIDITRLKAEYPYPVSGIASLNGKVTGKVTSPEVTGQLRASGVLLNGQAVSDMYASFGYVDGQADIQELRFSQGQGHYVFGGGVNFKTAEIDGLLRAEGGELTSIMTIANMPDRGIRGRLSGEIAVNGSMHNPNILLRGAIYDGKIKNYPLDTIDIDVEMENKIITVNTFTAKQGADGLLVVKGKADLNGEIEVEAGGRSIDIGILTALFDTTVETKGKFSFNAQATGRTQNPNVAVSLEVQNGSVAHTEFDNLYGLLVFDKGSIHVNQLYVARGPYKASAYGIVPLRALNSQGRSQADITDTMDLTLRLDNADLSILPLLTKEVAWAAGPTTGELAVGGTLAQPTLDGKVTVTNGKIKLKSLSDPIENVGVDIQFKGDTININAFDGNMGGGSYSMNGSARLNGLGLDQYDIMLTLDRLGVKHNYFSGPIDGVFTLTSQNNRPHIYGRLTVDNATVNIPAVPDGEAIAFNAGLDVEVTVGNKVRMYNPYLYDFMAEGKVKFAGTLQRPSASGRIEARRGTVRYLTNRFTIISGSADFIQFRSIEPVIRLQAQTRLSRTTINLGINGPVSAMDLKLTSEPAMSQEEILSLLTLRGSYFSKTDSGASDSTLGRDELVSLLDAGLQLRFIAEVESVLQETLGVDELRLVRSSLFDYGGRRSRRNDSDSQLEGYNLEVGKYLTDKFLISYSMGLDQDNNNSFGFRYDLTRNIGIGGSFGSDSKNNLLTVETRFTF